MAGGSGTETETGGVSSFVPPGVLGTSTLTRSQLVNTLQGHIDDLRNSLQCGICVRPLYEPFTIACGHTFCYTVSLASTGVPIQSTANNAQCLSSWFSGGRSKRTCPDCRAPVKTQPAPAYLVSGSWDILPD